ncbi:MAG: YfhO family protein [Flavobacteriales bacterium]
MKSTLLKALPHIVAVVTFVIISVAYFSPITDGYELRQGDIDHWRGMSKELVDYRLVNEDEPLWTDSMFGGMPAYQISTLHSNNLLSYIDQAYKLFLPGPIGILFIAMLGMYIFALCLRINPWIGIIGGIAFGLGTINILFLAGGHVSKVHAIAYMAPALGGLLMATRGKWILGAGIFSLFFALNVSANHLQMTYYLVILLGAVALTEAIRLIIAKQIPHLLKAGSALLVGGLIAVLPSMSNLMTTYEYSKYTTRGSSELTLTPEGETIDAGEKKGLDTDYILQYNFGKGEAWSLIIPNASGGKSDYIGSDKELLRTVPREFRENIAQSSSYWGDQLFTGGAFYFGAIIMMLFVLGLIFAKDTIKWPFLLLAIITVGLASQDPGGLNDIFINKFPLYNKFRDSKMILSVFQVMASAMAMIMVNSILSKEENNPLVGLIGNKKHFFIGVGAFALIMIVVTASPNIVTDFLSSGEKAQFSQIETQIASDPQQLMMYDGYKTALTDVRKEIFQADAGRSLMFIFAGIALIMVAYFKKLPAAAFIASIALLVLVDQYVVARRYLSTEKIKGQYINFVKPSEKTIPYQPSAADESIFENEVANIEDFDKKSETLYAAMKSSKVYGGVKDQNLLKKIGEYGVLGLNSDYRVLALGGTFSDAKTSYFHKSLGGYHGAKLMSYQEMIDFYLTSEIADFSEAMRTATDIGFLADYPIINMLNTKYVIYNPGAPAIENPFALGNAWFVQNIKIVDNANDELTQLAAHDLSTTAVIRKEFEANTVEVANADSTATIELIDYATKSLTYKSNNAKEQVAVFSEIYYPAGWTCTIDNQEVETFKANYILRAAKIPAGEHTIVWNFHPESYYKGSTYSLAGSILLILLVLGSVFADRKFSEKK